MQRDEWTHPEVPESYWHHTSPHISLSQNLPKNADVVVIGGGLFGTATAYWLARAGASVMLLERTMLAYGATGRNGGFVMSGTAEPYTAAIARLGHDIARSVGRITYENRALLRQVLAEEALVCDYREPGGLNLALGEEQLAAHRRDVQALQADGFQAVLLDRLRLQELIGTPLGSEIAGATLTPEQGLVHSARLIQELARAAQRHGATLCQAEALRLSATATGVDIFTNQGTLQAGAVVVAVNAWTSELLPVLAEYVTPVRGQILAYKPVAPVFKTSMSVDITATGEYWQQTLDGSIVLGGCRELAPGQDVGVKAMQPTDEMQAAIEQVLPRLFPELKHLIVARRWAGLMAFTADYLPIVDKVPGIERAWFMGGFCGHGMPFGMRFGQLLAETALQCELPAELWPFRLGRATLSKNQ